MIFNPFESRLCRDVRNKMGHAFVLSVQEKNPGIFSDAAADFRNHTSLPDMCHAYIDDREKHLDEILKAIKTRHDNGNFFIQTAALLWNRLLFFEVHEWLEEDWQKATGDEKRCLQALIMAATVYELMAYQREKPAKNLANKTIMRIKDNPSLLPKPFDMQRLISSLSDPVLVPPLF